MTERKKYGITALSASGKEKYISTAADFGCGRFRRGAVMTFIPALIFRKFPPVFNYPAVQNSSAGTPIMSIVAYT